MNQYKKILLIIMCILLSKLNYSFLNSNIFLLVYMSLICLVLKLFKLDNKYEFIAVLLFNFYPLYALVNMLLKGMVTTPINLFYVSLRFMLLKMTFEWLVVYFVLNYRKLKGNYKYD